MARLQLSYRQQDHIITCIKIISKFVFPPLTVSKFVFSPLTMQSSICILTFYEGYRTVSISLHRNTTDTERTTDTSLPNKRKFKVIHYIRNTIYKSTSKIKIDGSPIGHRQNE